MPEMNNNYNDKQGQNANRHSKGRPAPRRSPEKASGAKSKKALSKKPFADVANDKGEQFTLGNIAPYIRKKGLSLFRSEPKYHDIKVKRKEPFPAVTIFFMVICTMLVMFMIINYVQINETTRDIALLKSELDTLEGQKNQLALELEEKNDQREIEAYAGEYGMVTSDQLRRVYIDIENEDKIENYDDKEEDHGVIATVLNALGENMRAYWNIFVPSE